MRFASIVLIFIGLCTTQAIGAEQSSPVEPASEPHLRIVSLGSAVTETVFALGAGDELVAVDLSSTYPPDAVAQLPTVGYHRQISAEGIVSLRPTTVLATTDAGPDYALDQLRQAGVAVEVVPFEHDADSTRGLIRTLAGALGRADEGEALIERLDAKLADIQTHLESADSHPRVLFIYARGGGVLNVAGSHTGADTLIGLAGGVNAISDFEGYKPLTAEGVVTANPDVLFLLDEGYKSIGGEEGVLALPGVALTNAGKQRRIVHLDDNLALSFGPRLGEGVEALAKALHPELWKGEAQ